MAASNNNNTSVFFDPSTRKYMVFCDEIVIETIVTHEASIVDEWIQFVLSKYVGKQKVIGLDTEWTRTGVPKKTQVAILQLCIENKCLIIQLFQMDTIPISLRHFMKHFECKFAGVGVMNDLKMLMKDYGLVCKRGVDVFLLAKEKWPERISSGSLKYLAKELVGLEMEKSKTVCTSEWKSKELTHAQIEYACIDAYASFKIGKMILDVNK
ncbi:hypothetical protein VNO78_06999 [Psophocarpus tetragonolobus]|uniref:3'-5' exonuclease domain-containing protein n=1 Tax=Psophocarpus tetragonolobus TaxID=3891 RepID=A0AAN9T2M5_PSOTE